MILFQPLFFSPASCSIRNIDSAKTVLESGNKIFLFSMYNTASDSIKNSILFSKNMFHDMYFKLLI